MSSRFPCLFGIKSTRILRLACPIWRTVHGAHAWGSTPSRAIPNLPRHFVHVRIEPVCGMNSFGPICIAVQIFTPSHAESVSRPVRLYRMTSGSHLYRGALDSSDSKYEGLFLYLFSLFPTFFYLILPVSVFRKLRSGSTSFLSFR